MSERKYEPKDVSQVDIAFGSWRDLAPAWEDVPEEFKDDRTKWNRVISLWFFDGLPSDTEFEPADGIDPAIALRHVRAMIGSFEPKHEVKTASCAYLLSLWFKDVHVPDEAA